MTLDDQLIKKAYYEMFINEHEGIHPIRVLGNLLQEESKKDLEDLSHIRFAQGEVYFHNKDFEAAIFKWQNITNELGPWAKKNMADAYCALGILPTAEDLYKSIVSENLTLRAEVDLQLFSLYIERGKVDSAVQIIKKTVASNPDYPNVTEIARVFFEKQQDWGNAIELAVNEAVRTESLQWYEVLKTYVDTGLTKVLGPEYFSEALKKLYYLDQAKFEGLSISFWNSYKQESFYFSWLKEFNQLLWQLELTREATWKELAGLYKDTYAFLINGSYLIRDIEKLVPDVLTNWLRISNSSNAVLASTAVLSWNELFPSSITKVAVSEAELIISKTKNHVDEFEECLALFDSIIEWAGAHDMGDNLRLKWLTEQLTNFDTNYIFIAGLSGSGKSSFINFLQGEKVLKDEPTSSVVVFKDHKELTISEITDSEIIELQEITDFQDRLQRRRNALDSILEFNQPNSFLAEQKLAFIDSPGYTGKQYEHGEVLKYLSIADSILYVLDASKPFADMEQSLLAYLLDHAPETPIHFIINKMDTIRDEQEAIRVFDTTKSVINSYLPSAKVFAFSAHYDRYQQIKDLKEFIDSIKNTRNVEESRLTKLLFFIRATITMLLQKRIDVENRLIESVRWNEDIVIKLNGALNQLSDLEVQKARLVRKSYLSMKEAVQKDISESLPKQLKECSQLVKEDSDFSRIHLEINDVMNRKMQDYLENQVLPKYFYSLKDWINHSKDEFEEAQTFLNDMAEGFNTLYGDERMKLECDFKVLDDWRRDLDRMTSRLQLDNVNILLRRTPAQLLLKSAGKLFGAISQNKAMIHKKYQTFIETEDYTEPIAAVTKQFFQQFELFERSLERDITMFFRDSGSELRKAAQEARYEIEASRDLLQKMNTNPELFRDPLTLFEVRLRQFEWMTLSGENVHSIIS